MNIVKLNTTSDGFVFRGSGGGSSKGGMKYYDCLYDFQKEEHQNWNLANVKFVDFNSGDAYIGPDGWNGEEPSENANL